MSQHNPPKIIRAIWDSGAKASISCTKFLEDQRYFMNEKLENQRSLQTVGKHTSQVDLHRVLIPVKNKTFSHYMTHTLAVKNIIDPVPERNMKFVMDKAYDSYSAEMQMKNMTAVSRTQWPDGRCGGRVDFLLGVADLDFKLVFSFHGLIFISHDLEAKQSIAVGGRFDMNSFQRDHSDPVLTTEINSEGLSSPPDGDFQNTWNTPRDNIHTITMAESQGEPNVEDTISHRGGGEKNAWGIPRYAEVQSDQDTPQGISACEDFF